MFLLLNSYKHLSYEILGVYDFCIDMQDLLECFMEPIINTLFKIDSSSALCIKELTVLPFVMPSGLVTELPLELINAIYAGKGEQKTVKIRNKYAFSTPTKQYVFYFWLYSNCDRRIVISFDYSTNHKIWINGKLTGEVNDLKPMLYAIHTGYNLFVFTDGATRAPFLRISDEEYEKKCTVSAVYNIHHIHRRHIYIHDNGYCPYSRYVYEFYLAPGMIDVIDTASNVRIEVRLRNTEEYIYSMEIPFYTKGAIDLNEIVYDNSCLNWITISFLYMRLDGGNWMETRAFSFYPMQHFFEEAKDKVRLLISSESIKEQAMLECEKYMQEASKIDAQSLSALFWTQKIYDALPQLIQGKQISTPGVHRVFFKSNLDGNIETFVFRVPANYNEANKHPLLAVFNFDYAENCWAIAPENTIVLDLSCRGMTLGSYIGEAHFYEIMSKIKALLSIDESRIYAVGYCGEGTSALTLQQIEPGYFAAILISGASIIPEMVRNLTNTPIIAIESDEQLITRPDNRSLELMRDNLPLFRLECIESTNHDMLNRMHLQVKLINELMNFTVTKWPRRVEFKSPYFRHLSSYWIKANNFISSVDYVEFVAEYSDYLINVEVQGTTELTIQIPPHIKTRNGIIIIKINNEEIPVDTRQFGVISLAFINEHWHHVSAFKNNTSAEYRGTGLLDVYLGPVCVFAPKETTPNELDDAAVFFAQPKCWASNPNIRIQYPTIYRRFGKEDLLRKSNLIILDDIKDQDPTIVKLRSLLPVKLEEDGFYYQEKSYIGDYSIAQIVPNPNNPSFSILHIGYNRSSAVLSNIFIRKMALSSYASGINHYLNNVALIYLNKKYLVIKTNEGEIVSI